MFDGLDTDSYAVDTGSAGSFTACVSYLGYPIFFKEEHIYKVYGSIPSNFQVMGSATLGVAEGSAGSLAVAGEILFYLSRAGIMAYSGGIPQPRGGGLRPGAAQKRGGGQRRAEILRLHAGGGRDVAAARLRRAAGPLHTEDATHATHFARCGGNLYFLNGAGRSGSPGTSGSAGRGRAGGAGGVDGGIRRLHGGQPQQEGRLKTADPGWSWTRGRGRTC